MWANLSRRKRAIGKCYRVKVAPSGICNDHFRPLAAVANTAGNIVFADRVVGESGKLGDQRQFRVLKAPDPDQAGQMRAIDIGNLDQAVAVQIGASQRCVRPMKGVAVISPLSS